MDGLEKKLNDMTSSSDSNRLFAQLPYGNQQDKDAVIFIDKYTKFQSYLGMSALVYFTIDFGCFILKNKSLLFDWLEYLYK